MKKVAIIAGELSADILGSEIISSVKSNIFWFGVGGPNMRSKGFHEIMDWNFMTNEERKVIMKRIRG